MLSTSWQVFAVGLAGGATLELLHWYNIRKAARLPAYATRPFYWIVTVVMMLSGGGLAWLYFGSQAEAVMTFHIGLSTPLLIQKLTTTATDIPGGKGGDSPLNGFFKW